jgi:hypothetical protein
MGYAIPTRTGKNTGTYEIKGDGIMNSLRLTSIDEYKDWLRGIKKWNLRVPEILEDAKDRIKFLESIYVTGGENSYFSKEFKDAAYNERQNLCLLTSACYSILKEQGES